MIDSGSFELILAFAAVFLFVSILRKRPAASEAWFAPASALVFAFFFSETIR